MAEQRKPETGESGALVSYNSPYRNNDRYGQTTNLASSTHHRWPALWHSCRVTACISLQKPKVDVTIVVGQRALGRMAIEAGKGTKHKTPDTPFGPETVGDGDIDAEKPCIAGKAVEHTP